MCDDVCKKKVREFLNVGNATTDALRGYLGAEVSSPQFERVMAGLELAGEIGRGRWGVLAVWKAVAKCEG